MKYIDLRSDTVSMPTLAMRRAMAEAEVGDDGYHDDPTMIQLETEGAAAVGKEAALFVPSGTFGNQLALFTHCPRGSEVILDDSCHIVQHEAGASAVIAAVQLRTVETESGCPSAAQLAARIRDPKDYHNPPTSLLCLENAHSDGRAISLSLMEEVAGLARHVGIPVHLDGARIFNAATALGMSAPELCACADSVMFCLSKGLCAPVGSLLAGSGDFISQARRKRKIMGGQMRQAGVLAACGLLALSQMRGRLAEDHGRARELAAGLSKIPGLNIDYSRADINMVFLDILPEAQTKLSQGLESLAQALKAEKILVNPPQGGRMRLVTHHGIDDAALQEILRAFERVFSS